MPLKNGIAILAASAALVALAGGQTTPQTKAKAKQSAKTYSRKPAAKSSVKGKQAAKTASKAAPKTAAKKNNPQPAAIRRSYQQHPTPDRYKEIQQALADKGYFAGPVDGNWGADSVDALKRFQHDQNLTEDGKIGSLSLIAMGLGPKHDAAAPSSASPVGSAPPSDK